jgi:hypothetical protein
MNQSHKFNKKLNRIKRLTRRQKAVPTEARKQRLQELTYEVGQASKA